MPTGISQNFSQLALNPYKWGERVLREAYDVAANVSIPMGGIVAQLTGANTDDVQTISNTATGGTFTIAVGNTVVSQTPALACTTLTAAQLQAALNAAYAALCPGGPTTGYVTVTTTTPFSSGAGALVVTFNSGTAHTGRLSNNAQTLMVINNGGAIGGSVTVVHTTVGINNGAATNYNNLTITAPSTAPTLAGSGSSGTIGAGSYEIAYTYANSLGVETAVSDGAEVTITIAQSIVVTSITGLGSYVAKVNFYMDGFRVASVTPTSGATGTVTISAPPAAGAPSAPSAEFAANNLPFQATDGSQIPVGAAWYQMTTGPDGQVTFGSALATGNEYKPQWFSTPVAISGYFPCANLFIGGVAGIDQNTATTLGRLFSGSLSTGVTVFYGA